MEQQRLLIAVVLSVLIIVLYQAFVSQYYEPPPQPERERQKEAVTPPRTLPKPPIPRVKTPSAAVQQETKTIKVQTDLYTAVFTNRGARLKSFTLHHYRSSVDEDSAPFEMVSATPGLPFPLGIQLHGPNPADDENIIYSVQGNDLRLRGDAKGTLVFQGETPSGVTLIKKFTFVGSSYPIDLHFSVLGDDARFPPGLLLSSEGINKGPSEDAVFEGPMALLGTKLKSGDDLLEEKEFNGEISWAGFGYTYFLFALIPDSNEKQTMRVKQAGSGLLMDLSSQSPVGSESTRYTLFIGPKDLNILKSLERGLEESINFGYFGFVSAPLIQMLRYSHNYTASYGIDIIILTILMKLLLAPLTHKSFVSMKQMQKLQPQMERIKAKFKNDKEKLNKEIMELYRRNKVNPLGGCLPMVLQFPVFLGLYNALRTPIELRHAPFMWIQDLSRPDWEALPVSLGDMSLGLPVLTLLMGASMFLQQWMTPSAGDPNQRRMMLMMPVIFTALFVTFPAGLVIYWLVNNILSIGQQYLINRLHK